MSLPVLSIICFSRPDLITRLVSSIDYNIEIVVLVILEATSESLATSKSLLKNNSYISKFKIYYSYLNVGIPKAINYVIRNFLTSFIFFTDENVIFPLGFLSKLSTYLTNESTLSGVYQLKMLSNSTFIPSKFDCFIFTSNAYLKAGLFDENFYPRLIDGKEYDFRLKKQRCNKHIITNMYLIHDFQSFSNFSDTTKKNIVKCESLNWQYFMKKWRSDDVFTSYKFPFNNPLIPVTSQSSDQNLAKTQTIYLGGYYQPQLIELIIETSYNFTVTIESGDVYLTLFQDALLTLVNEASYS